MARSQSAASANFIKTAAVWGLFDAWFRSENTLLWLSLQTGILTAEAAVLPWSFNMQCVSTKVPSNSTALILFLGFPALKAQGNWDCMLSVWPGPESLTAPKSEALALLPSQSMAFEVMAAFWIRSSRTSSTRVCFGVVIWFCGRLGWIMMPNQPNHVFKPPGWLEGMWSCRSPIHSEKPAKVTHKDKAPVNLRKDLELRFFPSKAGHWPCYKFRPCWPTILLGVTPLGISSRVAGSSRVGWRGPIVGGAKALPVVLSIVWFRICWFAPPTEPS